MKKLDSQNQSLAKGAPADSRSVLEAFFIDSLQKMYYAERAISSEFGDIKHHILSPKLFEILKIHGEIQLKHIDRLEKIFKFKNEKIKSKNCKALNGLLSEALGQLSVFSNDIVNWEIALILVSQKFTYYKIASYGGLAHLAINLNYRSAATLLAFSVQDEEEFLNNNLNGLIDAFLSANVEGYKN
jgi:ferritin-like metal-binding protein YciE